MAVTYYPATVKEYFETVERVEKIRDEYNTLRGAESEAFWREHWEDLRATVVPPQINAVMIAELFDMFANIKSELEEHKALLVEIKSRICSVSP